MTRVYPHLVRPQDHPEFHRRWATATTWEAMDNRVQFAALRRFTEEKNRLVDIREKLDLYTRQVEMGKVIWPFVSTLYMDNFEELVDEVSKRGLYLFDFWGYVPGTNPQGQYWGHYRAPYRALTLMRERLGDRFLGMDNGEQDGRYIGSYAHLMYPAVQDRRLQYLNFCDFFAQLADDMGHWITVLCSLNYGHYFAAMGDHILLGAETAQALPNSNLWYAYLRGAGKQHGILWFGNASVWNRFGWKNYTASGGAGTNEEHGPEAGTSLSLLRRLLYTQYTYNCCILGFESGWFYAEGLQADKELKEVARPTPIGEVQHGCVQFAREHPTAGVLHTPTAVLLDFYNGWTFPRHLYTDSVYKAWGNVPYSAGDHQINALFRLIYPGFENAGFYHDERGFLTATPFGDAVDVLFNDARSQILRQYNLVIVAGEQRLDLEVCDKLQEFLSDGGHLVLTAAHLEGISNAGWLGTTAGAAREMVRSGTVKLAGRSYPEKPFEMAHLEPAAGAQVLATVNGKPFIVRSRLGGGLIDLIASPYGLNAEPLTRQPVTNKPDEDIPLYYDFLDSVRAFLASCLDEQKLVDVGNPDLQYSTNRLDATTLVVTLANNTGSWQPYAFASPAGRISAVKEWKLPDCPAETLGYFPAVSKSALAAEVAKGAPREAAIHPGDLRMFALSFDSLDIETRERIAIPDGGANRMLSLWNVGSLRDTLLTTERLGQHFTGVKIEAKYLLDRSEERLQEEGELFRRSRLGGMVDFIGLLDYYPKLTLIENIKSRAEQSIQTIAGVFRKMKLLGFDKALFALHRNSENNYSIEQAVQSFLSSYTELCDIAAGLGIDLYLVSRPLTASTMLWNLKLPGVTTAETLQFVRRVGRRNLRLAFDLSHSLMMREDPQAVLSESGSDVAMIQASAPIQDEHGQFYNAHTPIAGSRWEEQLGGLLRAAGARQTPICLNAVYPSWDAVYRDLRLLRG